MTSASINTRQKNVSLTFLKRAAEHISGATGGFISEVMPVSSSTIKGAKEGLQELNSTFSNTANSVLPKINQLKAQGGFRSISTWFMKREDDFDDNLGNFDDHLDFDIDSDPIEIVEAQISESTKNTNQISRTVLESSHKLVDAQVSATANLVSSTDKQTAVISSGFDRTNETLNKILEVLTKNTSTLIETTVAGQADRHDPSANDKSISSGKFRFDEYKKMVMGNMKNSELGMITGMLSMGSSLSGMFTPQALIQGGMEYGVGKLAPNMKKNMKALDSAVSDVIMGSLIRLGEHRQDHGGLGDIARIFGIDSSRKDISTERSSLELKAVPFDTIAKESLVGAIPGYLRHILVAVGGPDLAYDFRSRSFKDAGKIKKEFRDESISSVRGSLNNAGSNIKDTIGNNNFNSMIYDLMMNDLGSKNSNGAARNIISKFGDKEHTEEYILQTVLSGIQLSGEELEAASKFASNLGKASIGMGSHQMMNQVARNNVSRSKNMRDYVSEADAYGVDLSSITDSAAADKKALIMSYGRDVVSSDSDVSPVNTTAQLKGTNYTNIALYEIYRRLNEGINVFQVGSARRRKHPFEKFADDILVKPEGHKPKQIKSGESSINDSAGLGGVVHDDGSDNLLRNQQNEDGTSENLGRGQRFVRWGKQRGGNLAKAMFSGNADQVKEAFGLIVRDVTQVGGEQFKKGLKRVNDSFGNISGYMKHKLFGSGYSYDSGKTDDKGNPITVRIKDNDKGGAFGVVQDSIGSMFKSSKEKTMKWTKDVIKYFDYRGTGKPGEDSGMETKRRSFLFSSVGAMAGMGMLGGPLGLLFGAVAGNALSAGGIGDRLKELLFGKKDSETKMRDRKGLLTRAVDGIVDPIKYQIGKSFNLLGKQMKKNVFGPLSDIGLAIKGRITDAVSETSKTTFGKVFGFIGKMLMSPFKAIASTAKLPIELMGSMFRGATRAAGGAVGSTLGLTASLLATKEDRALIAQRKKDRDAQIEEDYKDGYEDYDTFKSSQDKSRLKLMAKLRRATKENKMTPDELIEYNKQIEEHSAEISESSKITAESTAELLRLGSEEGSIYTHDHGLHDRLDKLIELMGGNKTMKKKTASSEDTALIGNIISGTGSIITSGDVVNNEEARLGMGIIDEASKPVPNKSSVLSKFKALIGIQSKKKDEDPNKKESFLDKILNNWKLIAAGIVGGLALLNDNVGKVIGNIGSNLFEAGKSLWQWIKNGDKKGDNSNAPLNALTSPLDMRTNSASSYLNPLANIYHTQKDAAGNDIVNNNATRAKDATWKHLALQASTRGMASVGYGVERDKHLRLADKAKEKGLNLAANKQTELANAAGSKSQDLKDNIFGKGAGSIGKGMAKVGVGLAGGQAIGKTAGYFTSQALQSAGLSKDWADTGGRVAETVGTIGGTISMVKNGWSGKIVDWGVEKSKWVLDQLSQAIAKNKKLSSAAKPVSDFLSKVGAQITTAALKPLTSTLSKLAIKLGAQIGVGALTFGVGTALFAGAGAIIQGLDTENLFGVRAEEADKVMVGIATTLGGIFNLPFVCLIEVIDIILAPANNGKGVRQSLAEIIYNSIQGDGGSVLSKKQGNLKSDVDAYNKKYKTNLNSSAYNDMTNKGLLDKIWTGGTKTDENGQALFDDNGARLTNGGLKEIVNNPMGTIKQVGSSILKSIGSMVSDASKGISDASKDIDAVASGKMTIFDSAYWSSDIVDDDPNPLGKVGKIAGFINRLYCAPGAMIGYVGTKAIEGFQNVSKGLSSIIDAGDATIQQALNGTISPFSDQYWAAPKSDGESVIGGIAVGVTYISKVMSLPGILLQLISKKLSNLPGIIRKGIKNLFGDIPENNVGGNNEGGPLVDPKPRKIGGIGGPLDQSTQLSGNSFKVDKDPLSKKGNPLNKSFDITSKLGIRDHPVYGGRRPHKGIDMAPSDGSGEAQVGAVFPGKIVDVNYQPGGAGNYVSYQTPDGALITNMHLKDKSIPRNLKPGSMIQAGDKIGDMGSTGASTGPHLHYQIEKDGEIIDPEPLVTGAATLSSFKSSAPGGSPDSSKTSAGPLGSLLGAITKLGSAALNKISGGLFGSSNTDTSSINDGSSVGSFDGLTNGPVQKQVYDFLKKKGLSHAATVGIMANIQQESNFNPNAVEKGTDTPGHGLCQWTGSRSIELKEFAASRGKDWTDLETQLEMLWRDISTNHSDMDAVMKGQGKVARELLQAAQVSPHPQGLEGFKTINDSHHATGLFEAGFERAGKPMMGNRFAAAQAFDKEFIDKTAGKGGGLDEIFSKSMKRMQSKISDRLSSGAEKQVEDFVQSNIIDKPNSSNKSATVNAKPDTPKVLNFAPKTVSVASKPEVSPTVDSQQSVAANNNTTQGVNQDQQSSSTSNLESLMTQVLYELKAINNHTANSSGQLESLNQKDFVDVGVRDSISALGKTKSRRPPQVPYNHGNTRAINSMIRP